MGRDEPLIAMALGRSPYDEVVIGGTDGDGEGEENAKAPGQEYDSRGRPVNAETRRINRDIVRSHNEVMLVIGVAEPESVPEGKQAGETRLKREHVAHESLVGSRILLFGRALWMVGTWGVSGLFSRLFLYRRYSYIPFFELFSYERRQRSPTGFFFAGIQSFALSHGLRWVVKSIFEPKWEKSWFQGIWTYVRLHLLQFMLLKKLDLIPANVWFPSVKFFIPFTESSLIPPLPPLPRRAGLGLASVGQWLGAASMVMVPFAAFYLSDLLWTTSVCFLAERINAYVPDPSHGSRSSSLVQTHQQSEQSEGPELTEPREQVEQSNRTAAEFSVEGTTAEDATMRVAPMTSVESIPPPASSSPTSESGGGRATDVDTPVSWSPLSVTPPVRTGLTHEHQHGPPFLTRRVSTFSGRGEDDGTDDEEFEGLNAPVISFDVELMEETSNNPPAGMWSAELRPNAGPELCLQETARPIYTNTVLARLPAFFATEILSSSASWLLAAPVELVAVRLVGRGFALRHGLAVTGMYESVTMATWSSAPPMRIITNFLGVEFVRLMIGIQLWALMAAASHVLHVSDEDWWLRHLAQLKGATARARGETSQAAEEEQMLAEVDSTAE